MWRLIKSGIDYHRFLFIGLYIIALLLALGNAAFGAMERFFMIYMLLSLMILGLVVGPEERRDKMERLSVGLPIPLRLVGLSRYPIVIAYWLSLLVLLWTSRLISFRNILEGIFPWVILSISGLFLNILAWMSINIDLDFFHLGKTKAFLYKTGAVSMAVLSSLVFVSLMINSDDAWIALIAHTFFTPAGSLIVLALGLAMCVLSQIIFERRKSYVE